MRSKFSQDHPGAPKGISQIEWVWTKSAGAPTPVPQPAVAPVSALVAGHEPLSTDGLGAVFHSSFPVGQRVRVTKGEYAGDMGIVQRQEGAKTVYQFQVKGQWGRSEWAYTSAMHEHYGILPM